MRFVAIISALAAAVSAYTQPNYSQAPTGNAIYTPGLNQQVPAGSAFDITWDPTTDGTVSLVLLRGPSNNVQPLYAIAEKIPNTGSFSWTPSTNLEADVTHYGLLLVVDATGQYQYSTQFGISNSAAGSSSSVVASSIAIASSSAVATPSATLVPILVTTTICPETTSSVISSSAISSGAIYAIGTGNASVPVVSPTKTPYLPTTLKPVTTATGSSASPQFTGAADRNMISFGGVAAVAGLAAVLAF